MKEAESVGIYADLVAAILAEKGWTSYRLAKESGLTVQAVDGITRGNVPRCDTLVKLLTAAGLDADWFAANMPPPLGKKAAKKEKGKKPPG